GKVLPSTANAECFIKRLTPCLLLFFMFSPSYGCCCCPKSSRWQSLGYAPGFKPEISMGIDTPSITSGESSVSPKPKLTLTIRLLQVRIPKDVLTILLVESGDLPTPSLKWNLEAKL